MYGYWFYKQVAAVGILFSNLLIHTIVTDFVSQGEEIRNSFSVISVLFSAYYSFLVLLEFRNKGRSNRRWRSSLGLVDIMSSFPPLMYQILNFYVNLGAVTAESVNFLITLRILKLYQLQTFVNSDFKKQVFGMTLQILSMVYVFTSLISSIERVDFFSTLFLTITSVTTVGYNDIIIRGKNTRILAIILILLTWILVPMHTQNIISTLKLKTIYQKQKYPKKTDVVHGILCNFGYDGHKGINSFFKELYHEDHKLASNVKTVVLNEGDPDIEMRMCLSDPKNSFYIQYLDGSPFSKKDLTRAAADTALCVFIFVKKIGADTKSSDLAAILTVMAMLKYRERAEGKNSRTMVQRTKCRFFIQLRYLQSCRIFDAVVKSKFQRTGFMAPKYHYELICIEELKNNLIAKSCLCFGFITFISNLINSCDSEDNSDDRSRQAKWDQEYHEGTEYELYCVPISEKFNGLKFSDVSLILYEYAGITLFALEISSTEGISSLLNPSDFKFDMATSGLVKGFLIAKDKDQAMIASLAMVPGNSLFNAQMQEIESEIQEVKNKTKRRRVKRDMKYIGENTENEFDKFPSISNQDDLLGASLHQLKQKYNISTSPFLLSDRLIRNNLIQDFPDVRGHILVISDVADFYTFLLPLRSRSASLQAPIVWICPKPMTEAEWAKCSYFPNLYVYYGNPYEPTTLRNCGVKYASNAVIMNHTLASNSSDTEDSSNPAIQFDSKNIMIFHTMMEEFPELDIVCELSREESLGLLQGRLFDKSGNDSESFQTYPVYAGGYVYHNQIVDNLIAQIFHNPSLMTVIRQLIVGTDANALDDKEETETRINLNAYRNDSQMYSVAIPSRYQDLSYGEIFKVFVENGILPIGIRRGIQPQMHVGPNGNRLPYVYTNPVKTAKLYECDTLFCLATQEAIDRQKFSAGPAKARKRRASFCDFTSAIIKNIHVFNQFSDSAPADGLITGRRSDQKFMDSEEESISAKDFKAKLKRFNASFNDARSSINASIALCEKVVDHVVETGE